MKLDIGGGQTTPDGWVNLDPVHGTGPWKRQAQDIPWPTDGGTVQAARASHVLEHIPAGRPRIDVFNEAHRVIRPGGTLDIVVPLLIRTDGAPSWQAVADPTHVSYWVRESFDYLTHPRQTHNLGVKLWELTDWNVIDGWEAHALLTRP